ncbi:MAG: hypothetical protein WCT77_08755 [Bacteroidota bacterium]
MKKLFTLVILFAFLFVSANQNSTAAGNRNYAEDIQPFRIGLKIGLPNIAGGAFEFVTPFVENKLAVNASLSYIPFTGDNSDETWTFVFWDIGLNYYFFNKGKGLFAGLNYARLSVSFKEKNMNGYYTGPEGTQVLVTNGTGEVTLGADLVQFIVGYRFIWGYFTLEPEIGYQAGKMDNRADVVITYSGGKAREQKEVPGSLGLTGISLGIMLGVAF